jgi:hypothetical protein
MSKISTAICRSFFLWWHLGIGPLIGAGPMQARVGTAEESDHQALER